MLEERLHCVTASEPEEQWKQMKTILQETVAEVVGLSTKKHQDWFDEADAEIQELLEKKHSCQNHLLEKPDDQAAKAAYKTACSALQAKLRIMQNNWWTGLDERTQGYADMGDMHAFYEALKAVHGPSHQIQAPLRSSDGSILLTDKGAILQCWSEHFKGLFNDRRTVQESSLAKIPQIDVKLDLFDPPTCEEIRKAKMQLKVGKSPGIDGIQQKSISMGEKQCSMSSRICSPTVGTKELYRRTSGMQSLCLCTKTRDRNQTVHTTEASLCSPLQCQK